MTGSGKEEEKTRARWTLWLPVALWMAVIFALGGLPPQPERIHLFRFMDKLAHLLEFGVLGLLTVRAAYLGGQRSRSAYWLCIGLAVLYGALDELHQYFIPGRSVEAADVAADGLGIVLLAWAYLGFKGERLFTRSGESDKMGLITR